MNSSITTPSLELLKFLTNHRKKPDQSRPCGPAYSLVHDRAWVHRDNGFRAWHSRRMQCRLSQTPLTRQRYILMFHILINKNNELIAICFWFLCEFLCELGHQEPSISIEELVKAGTVQYTKVCHNVLVNSDKMTSWMAVDGLLPVLLISGS